MKVESHNLSDDANDGSRNDMRGDEYDEQRYASRDKRANTDTTFYEHDLNELAISPQRRQTYERMLEHQEGYYVTSDSEQSRGQQNYEEWTRRMVGTFSSQVELSDYQKNRVLHLIQDVLDINSFGSYSVEEVVIGVINHVAREDGRCIGLEDQFLQLAEDVGMGPDDAKRVRLLVRDRL